MRRRNFLRVFGSLPIVGGLFAAKAVAGEPKEVVEGNEESKIGLPIMVVVEGRANDKAGVLCEWGWLKRNYPGPERHWCVPKSMGQIPRYYGFLIEDMPGRNIVSERVRSIQYEIKGMDFRSRGCLG